MFIVNLEVLDTYFTVKNIKYYCVQKENNF